MYWVSNIFNFKKHSYTDVFMKTSGEKTEDHQILELAGKKKALIEYWETEWPLSSQEKQWRHKNNAFKITGQK